jgi:excisionase family DNA binding protein
MPTDTEHQLAAGSDDYPPVPVELAAAPIAPDSTKTTARSFVGGRETGEQRDRLALSVPEVARLLGISRALAYELVAQGEIPSIRLRHRILVPKAALAALLDSALR